MSPTYKLVYFDVRGFAEPARFLFYLAGVPFEDQRLSYTDGEWEKMKDSTPFGHLPILKVDDLEIAQSAAIVRYLAKKFGFAGKTAEEQAQVDSIVDQFKDFFESLRPMFMAQRAQKPAEEIQRIRETTVIPAVKEYFAQMNRILAKNPNGFLVGDSLTWADLVVADNLETLEKNGLFEKDKEEKLEKIRQTVYSRPELQDWLNKRPDTIV